MKILKLKIKNLNSLVGETVIDFTDQAYEENSIFAIIGPTGSGKSTILDAICLALYGETPRLGKITLNSNEIMSRHTGECASEIIFTIHGKKYKAHWRQHRANRQAKGALQSPKHDIAIFNDGEYQLVAEKASKAKEKIEDITGLDFQRFNRSIMLAQGGFAAFLNASDQEKSEILEQITGTEIYRDISIRVYQKYKEQQEKLDQIKAIIDNEVLLTHEEKGEIKEKLSEISEDIQQLTKKQRTIEDQIQKRHQAEKLEQRIKSLQKEFEEFQTKKRDNATKLAQLPMAEKADLVAPFYDRLHQCQKEFDAIQKQLKEVKKEKPAIEKEFETIRERLKTDRNILTRQKKEREEKEKLFHRVRQLDHIISQIQKQVDEKKFEENQNEKKEAEHRLALSEIEQELSTLLDQKKGYEYYLERHQKDEDLIEDFGRISLKIGTYDKDKEQAIAINTEIEKNRQQLVELEKKSDKLAKAKAELESEISEQKQKIAKNNSMKTDLLKGKSIADMRSVLDQVKENILTHKELSSFLREEEKLQADIGTAGNAIKDLVKQGEAADERLRQLTKKLEVQKELQTKQNKIIFQQERIKQLSERRKALVDGEPCPLCGATDHPYVTGEIPASDDEKTKLAVINQTIDEFGEKITADTKEVAALKSRLDNKKDYKKELVNKKELLQKSINTILQKIKIDKVSLNQVDAAVEDMISQQNQLNNTIKQAEKLLETENQLKANLEKQKERFQQQSDKLKDLKFQIKEMQQTNRTMMEKIDEFNLDKQKKELEKIASTYEVNYDALEREIKQRKDKYQKNQQQLSGVEQKKSDLNSKQQVISATLKNITQHHTQLKKKINELTAENDSNRVQRKTIFGIKDPDKEAKKLREHLHQLETTIADIEAQKSNYQAKLERLKQRIVDARKQREESRKNIAQAERNFRTELKKQGFPNKIAFKHHLIPKAKIQALRQLQEKQKLREEQLKTSLTERKNDLAPLKSVPQLAELFPEKKEIDVNLDKLKKEAGALHQKLDDDQLRRKKQAQKVAEYEKQEKICNQWYLLNQLIGSADGKKFSRFAQGITFQVMIAYANEQLRKMNDRYMLLRDETEPMKINVIDNYQAGITRPVETLSGGESFIVSLALALGLSNMASENVKIDSLFLDEGFGTLDENALEPALETLHELQSDGKLIGIISHVPALKERIPVQIEAVPQSGGHSRLKGPGIN